MLLMGLIVSWLMVALGALRAAHGLFVAYGSSDAESLAYFTRRYFGSRSTGEVIDQGLLVFVCGIALGVLVTIGRELQLRNRELRRREHEQQDRE